MELKSFRLRTGDKKKMWIVLTIFITTLAINFVLFQRPIRYWQTLILDTAAFIWFPVLVSYLFSAALHAREFSFLKDSRRYDLNMLQRSVVFFIACVLLIIIFTLIEDDAEAVAWMTGIYAFIVFPAQLALILIIDFLRFIKRKFR